MRSKKSDLYEKEQKEILDKLLEILEINDDNRTIIIYNIDKNKEKIDAILSLKEDVHKYFNSSKWSLFRNYDNKNNKEHILLIRGLLNAMNVDYVSTSIRIKEDGKLLCTSKYSIIKI